MSNVVNITNEEIEELRKKGLTYRAIANHFKEQGIKVSFQAIEQRCRAIYRMKHEEETSQITDEEIYEEREKGTSYKAIAEYFEKKGKKISPSTIKKRCKEIYMAKREKEPKTKYIPRKISEELDDEIFELREKRLSYKQISEYFEKQGKKVSLDKIRAKCKKIYKKRNKREPKANWRAEVISDISDNEIYELRKKGVTYQAISEYFEEQGKKIDQIKVSERCKEIFEEKGEKQPNLYLKQSIDISYSELYEQREKGLTYAEISEYFKGKGIETSPTLIRVRCKKIYELIDKKEPMAKTRAKAKKKTECRTEKMAEAIDEGSLREGILRLQETKGATPEQIEQIAKLYGIDLTENKAKVHNDER